MTYVEAQRSRCRPSIDRPPAGGLTSTGAGNKQGMDGGFEIGIMLKGSRAEDLMYRFKEAQNRALTRLEIDVPNSSLEDSTKIWDQEGAFQQV